MGTNAATSPCSFARNSDGSVGQHDGQVWRVDPGARRSASRSTWAQPRSVERPTDGPDNITVSPWGGLFPAEDGEGVQHLHAVTRFGETVPFAATPEMTVSSPACISPPIPGRSTPTCSDPASHSPSPDRSHERCSADRTATAATPDSWDQTAAMAEHERCDACGFDGAVFDDIGLLVALRSLGGEWQRQLDDAGRQLRPRPEPDTWSAIEYAAHSRDVTTLHALRREGGV